MANEDGTGQGAATPAPSVASATEPAPSSPATSPVPVTPSQVSSETTPDSPGREAPNEFQGLGLEDFDIGDEQPDTGQEAPPSPQATTPTTPVPPVEAKPPPGVEAKPASQPAQPAEGVPRAEGPSSSPLQIDAILAGMEQPETAAQLRAWLAQNSYALTQEEKDGLDTDAVGMVPKLLSRVHLESTKNTLKLISTLVPQMVEERVQKVLQTRERGQEAMGEFFRAWPSLDQGKHSNLVNEFARLYRANNPRASRQDAIKFVGAAIHAHLGLSPVAAPQANGQASIASARNAPPFAPARPGARQVANVQVDENPWMALGQDFED